ncbi:MAG: phosphatase PAP2 family protein [Alistipes sp.]|nr:phosphatase PAP2 family protein [Alistipes sp.]
MWQSLIEIDKELLLALNGDGGSFWDSFFYIASAKLTWVPLYVALLYAVWHRYGLKTLLWMLLFLGIGIIAADQICNFFKHNTPKFRPTHTPDIQALVHTVHNYRGGLYGTVSAHAAISVTLALFTARLFQNWRYTLGISLWALLVIYSRIYLGVHFPMDLLLGSCLGLLLGNLLFLPFRRQLRRRGLPPFGSQ